MALPWEIPRDDLAVDALRIRQALPVLLLHYSDLVRYQALIYLLVRHQERACRRLLLRCLVRLRRRFDIRETNREKVPIVKLHDGVPWLRSSRQELDGLFRMVRTHEIALDLLPLDQATQLEVALQALLDLVAVPV